MANPEYGGNFWAHLGDLFAATRGALRLSTSSEKKLDEAWTILQTTGAPPPSLSRKVKKLLETAQLVQQALKKVPPSNPEKRAAARKKFLNNAAKIQK